ncbi:MAG: gamma-glutamylcyclotransferase [Pseudomonadota bacterium]
MTAHPYSSPDDVVSEADRYRNAERAATCDGGFWVFGYGSLMWDPGFAHVERREALLHGFARRFCMWSVHYRGTPEDPGLVLALLEEAGAATEGVAYRVSAAQAPDALGYLQERELVSSAYRETTAEIVFGDERVRSIAYVMNTAHPQFAGGLTLDDQAEVIERAIGPRGRNCEYLFNTVAHLQEIGVQDLELERLAQLVRERRRT